MNWLRSVWDLAWGTLADVVSGLLGRSPALIEEDAGPVYFGSSTARFRVDSKGVERVADATITSTPLLTSEGVDKVAGFFRDFAPAGTISAVPRLPACGNPNVLTATHYGAVHPAGDRLVGEGLGACSTWNIPGAAGSD